MLEHLYHFLENLQNGRFSTEVWYCIYIHAECKDPALGGAPTSGRVPAKLRWLMAPSERRSLKLCICLCLGRLCASCAHRHHFNEAFRRFPKIQPGLIDDVNKCAEIETDFKQNHLQGHMTSYKPSIFLKNLDFSRFTTERPVLVKHFVYCQTFMFQPPGALDRPRTMPRYFLEVPITFSETKFGYVFLTNMLSYSSSRFPEYAELRESSTRTCMMWSTWKEELLLRRSKLLKLNIFSRIEFC